jgi:transposase
MKNKIVIKQVLGIDIGKDTFFACYKIKHDDNSVIIKGTKSFNNNIKGLDEFYLWSESRNKTPEIKPVYVMEATGVYYEELAYFLFNKKQIVSVHLAQKLKYYAKGCNLKTKTDKVDAIMIAEFGIEKNLTGTDLWTPPGEDFKMIRDLSREHTSLTHAQTSAKCQLHALQHGHDVYKEVIKLKEQQLVFYKEQIKAVELEIRKLVESDSKLHSKIKNIETVKGLAFITIMKILTEVNGFLLFKNIRQLVSYAGLDVIEKQSGKHAGKTKISKKGNARIRAALFMPAMSAIQHNKTLKTFYERVNEGRTIRMQGLVAVMRKLLILIFTLWNKDEVYNEHYMQVGS